MLLPGALTSVGALIVVRPAYLYDTRFDENLGMFYTGLLAAFGVVLTGLAIFTMRHTRRTSVAAALVTGVLSLVTFGFVLWVAGHNGRCVGSCGPY